jgi:hypothetical protein
MNKDKDQLVKNIAEDYFFKGKELSSVEESLIKNSSYVGILKPKNNSKFNSLIENAISVEEEKFKPTLRKRIFTLHNYNKAAIRELLSKIESKFNLQIYNKDFNKFCNVDLEALKKLIKDYADTQVYDDETENFLKNLTEKDSVMSILFKLYSC